MTPRAIASRVVGWRTARRYGVPASMVAETTRRRLAGDWRGSCEAARFDVQFDLGTVRREFGVELAARVEDDLHHLVPDLVRWHLPREPQDDDGPLEPNLAVPLARYGEDNPVVLWVRTPAYLLGSQRVEVHVGPLDRVTPRRGRLVDSGLYQRIGGWSISHRVDSWIDTRDLWDARATAGLRQRLFGDRTAFFTRDGRRGDDGTPASLTERVIALQEAGQLAEAWTTGGIPTEFRREDGSTGRPENWFGSEAFALVPALATAARRWWVQQGFSDAAVFALRPYQKTQPFSLLLTVDDRAVTATVGRWPATKDLPSAPRSWWHRLPELELLRLGELALPGLHPLVRASLFPDHQGDPDEYRPVEVVGPDPVRVRCRGEWHQVGWRDGRIAALNHAADEELREQVMSSLGGEVPRCFRVVQSWRASRVPSRPLRLLRRHGVLTMRHGDLDEVTRLLDLGVDPAGLRDDGGRNLLHHAAHLNSLPLLHRLLAAGLEVNRADSRGRTPLACSLHDGASKAIVEALLDAGADPTVIDDGQANLLHLLRSPDAAAFLPRLLAAGLDLEARDSRGHTPLLAQLLGDAPAAAIRAVWAAGADPTARGTREGPSAAELAVELHRFDVDFREARRNGIWKRLLG